MKKAIKKLKSLFLVFVTIVLTIQMVSCDKDEFETLNDSQNGQLELQVKKISFKDVKLNKNAFEKLKESRSKINPSLSQRGIYNEDFGFFIDTTNIVFIEKDGKHSYTFQIINEEDKSIVENLILNSKVTEGYDAFISKYLLTQEEIVKIENGESLETKVPSTITNVNSTYSAIVSGPCVTSTFSSQFVCYPDNGGEPVYYGGNYSGGCNDDNSTLVYETTQIISINYGCLTGGSGGSSSNGGYNPGGGSNSGGYNPGGYWTGGGSGSSGGSQTNPNNPVLTTPNINYPTVPRDFLSSLSDDQLNWWNAIENSTPRNEIITYLNNNKIEGTNLVIPEALAFALELIDYCIENNNSQESINEINNILDLIDDGKINGEEVVVGPDTPITDMADYLSCFNTSQGASITIYADQPKSGSHNLLGPDRVGHAFISIQQGSNIVTLGFYPESTIGSVVPNGLTLDPTDFLPTPGVFGNDQGHNYDVSLTVPINSGGLTNLINGLISVATSNPVYNLGSSNCTDIALLLFESTTSIDIPNCNSPRPYWNGQTPGTLGEVIRTMPTPAGGTKNTNGGNAPNNNCN